ncbi:MAG: hypothetical protein IKV94_04535 [Clostridia bacterium]|nr:hypothetical protein [Clostridia bacterium]
MKVWIKLIVIVLSCLLLVGGVYVWKFGFPEFENKEEKFLNNLVQDINENYKFINFNVDKTYEYSAKLDGNNVVFEKSLRSDKLVEQSIVFEYAKNTINTAIEDAKVDSTFSDIAITCVFEAVASINGYEKENASYSLIADIIDEKTLEKDGYTKTNQHGVTRFWVYTNKDLNLANKQDVYIKPEDLDHFSDILDDRLQYKLIEKPGIVFEKNVSYGQNLVFVIYEKDGLTQRTYKSMLSMLDVVVDNPKITDYIKENYPIITRAGTLSLDGITISLNEKLGEGNVHYYQNPGNYEYMLFRINIDKIKK